MSHSHLSSREKSTGCLRVTGAPTTYRFRSRRADLYLRKLDCVDGWLDRFSAEIILATSRFQHERGIGGGVAEIGIHHGKLFLLLYLATNSDETAVAIDVFDQQFLNVDGSGRGDKARFLRHATRVAGDLSGISMIEA